MVDDNNKQQHLSSFKHYIQHLGEAKKDLEAIKKKKPSDVKKFHEEINTLYAKHSSNCYAASGHYGAGELWNIAGCSSDLNKYKKIVDELNEIKNETYKSLKATQCAYDKCKKTNLTNPCVYKEADGYKTVFCNQNCLSKYLEKINKYTCE